jgi:hypothetical protein
MEHGKALLKSQHKQKIYNKDQDGFDFTQQVTQKLNLFSRNITTQTCKTVAFLLSILSASIGMRQLQHLDNSNKKSK